MGNTDLPTSVVHTFCTIIVYQLPTASCWLSSRNRSSMTRGHCRRRAGEAATQGVGGDTRARQVRVTLKRKSSILSSQQRHILFRCLEPRDRRFGLSPHPATVAGCQGIFATACYSRRKLLRRMLVTLVVRQYNSVRIAHGDRVCRQNGSTSRCGLNARSTAPGAKKSAEFSASKPTCAAGTHPKRAAVLSSADGGTAISEQPSEIRLAMPVQRRTSVTQRRRADTQAALSWVRCIKQVHINWGAPPRNPGTPTVRGRNPHGPRKVRPPWPAGQRAAVLNP